MDEIEGSGDRRATIPLLDAFLARGAAGADDDKAAEIADVLAALEDPRSAAPLLAEALDPGRPAFRRALAIQTLASVPVDDPPRGRCLAWASDPDPILRALGVQYLDAQDGARIAIATADSDVLVRRTATEALGALVRTTTLVAALRRALRDEDAVVREIACRVALFDEPLEASWDLQRALADPSIAVRCNAIEALAWYPQKSVLLALADARGASATDRASVDEAFETIVRRIVAAAAAAPPPVRHRIERWAAPVAWLIDSECRRFAGADGGSVGEGALGALGPATSAARRAAAQVMSAPEPVTAPQRRRAAVDVADAERLEDPETPAQTVREVLGRRSWKRAGSRGLALLRRLSVEPNWSVRQMTARAFADLGAFRDLVRLATDSEPVVRRAAFLASLDADSDHSDRDGAVLLGAARLSLADPAMRPTAGDPALAVIAAYAAQSEVERTVVAELSRGDDRDGIYLGAIHLSRYAGVLAGVPALVGIVRAPIIGQVRTHVAALQALRSLGQAHARIDLTHLEAIDHLEIVEELGHWPRSGARR